jgi:Flp pilus assembly protein TadD
MLLENKKLDVANLAGKIIVRFPARRSDLITDPVAVAKVKQFEQQVGGAIADSFNNLGAISAQSEDYVSASAYFKQAAEWNPTMEGLDYNWGRAAFGAKDYRQAVTCLSRYMQAYPDDARPRVPLGMSQFLLSDYSGAIHTLSPLGAQLETVPLLAYAYADSLVKTGDLDEGVDRLERLEQADPSLAAAPIALGEAFASQKQYQKAEVQLQTALRIDPANKNAKYDLALTLISLGQKDELESLINELAVSGTSKSAVYYHLGKLQLDRGDTAGAIASLEAAARLAPEDDAVRQELTEAHHRKVVEETVKK